MRPKWSSALRPQSCARHQARCLEFNGCSMAFIPKKPAAFRVRASWLELVGLGRKQFCKLCFPRRNFQPVYSTFSKARSLEPLGPSFVGFEGIVQPVYIHAADYPRFTISESRLVDCLNSFRYGACDYFDVVHARSIHPYKHIATLSSHLPAFSL